jgi:Glycosyl transferase family 11
MISTILKWGLCNRLFLIANTYVISLQKNVPCIFYDKYSYDIQHHINFKYSNNIFSKLNFIYDIFDNKKIYDYIFKEEDIIKYYKDNNLTPIKYSDLSNFNDNFILTEFNTNYIDIINYQKELCDLFINEEVINEIRIKYNKYLNNSVSLNIRRGDFLHFFKNRIESVDYYLDGIKEIEKKKQIDNILVVSDDIPWCKENFKDNRNIFIEEEDYLQLYLMTLCENFIVSDSTFSWWGVFLNKNENKIVIYKNEYENSYLYKK